jgi:hypothetical protein
VATIAALAPQLLTGDGAERLEARATLQSLAGALGAERGAAAVPPPADQRDPRPLAQAIVGSWQAGPMALTFGSDGTLRAVLPGARAGDGHWSVDPSGELRADVLGQVETSQAWIVGDTLTLSVAGRAMSFQRTSGG